MAKRSEEKKTPATAPEAAAATPENPPTWTLTAAERFDLLALHWIVQMAEGGGYVNQERLEAMRAKLREFEFYEERHHR